MNVLIACEESQRVTIEMRSLGYEAWSCDTLPCSGGHPEWHIQDDVIMHLDRGWDLIIAHPPCTYLANSGVQHLHKSPERWILLDHACDFFNSLMNAPCNCIAVENPIPHKYAIQRIGRKYDQIIQPWQFGHPERKATCFWLKNLPMLTETDNVKEEMLLLPKNQSQRIFHMPPGPERSKLRSKTFSGIAKAMAEQWGPAAYKIKMAS